MQKRLNKLLDITKAILNAEKTNLKKIISEEKKIHNKINALDAKVLERIHSLNNKGGADLALYSGKDVEWERWRQREKAKLNMARAALLAKQEEQIQQAKVAFGKNEAVSRLLEASVLQKEGSE